MENTYIGALVSMPLYEYPPSDKSTCVPRKRVDKKGKERERKSGIIERA